MESVYEDAGSPLETSPPAGIMHKRQILIDPKTVRAGRSVEQGEKPASQHNPHAFLSSHEKGIIAKYELHLNEYPGTDSPERRISSKLPVFR